MSTYEKLRQHALRTGDPPHSLANKLADMLGVELTQKVVVAGFKRAFPSLPLPVLLEAGGWHRVSDGDMPDSEFDALLGELIAMDLAGGG
ncbi:hypothetical protein G6O69_01030 [Pseudenhygromyxa sp. WMMC2535]|uniref:hypothetical protein n=1 Tax=Pseudenhygromyxa sp. WMMC2535 TaxID=2712867 RepID=UPI00155651FA|nr:hypothetical protein [Pseudenhygromyxa sp. WMMC2535]NVB36394.1 hypothetical protein [Pseudenhygromyxa sp. WMMC2535]